MTSILRRSYFFFTLTRILAPEAPRHRGPADSVEMRFFSSFEMNGEQRGAHTDSPADVNINNRFKWEQESV